MTLLTKHTHRLAFSYGQDHNEWQVGGCPLEKVYFPSGVSLRFQIGVYVYSKSGSFYNMSDVTSATCEVKQMAPGGIRPTASDPTYMTQTIETLDAATITAEGWANGTEQHASFDFTAAETALEPGSYWLVFSGILNDLSSVSFGWGEISVVEDGTGVASPVAALPPSYYTAAQIDALLATGGSGAAYDPDSYVEQSDANFIYFAWARLDGTGYIADRRNLSTGQAAGAATGTLPIPADLTALEYA